MPWNLLVIVFLLTWAGSALLIDGLLEARRPSLMERVRPFHPTIADEAELWLRRLRP